MKFLVDAHLPPGVCEVLRSAGHDAIHTRDLPHGNRSTDQLINEASIRDQRVVLSKDSDFYYSHILHGKPWRLIIIRTGNIRGRDLINMIRSNLPAIETALADNTLIELDHEELTIVK